MSRLLVWLFFLRLTLCYSGPMCDINDGPVTVSNGFLTECNGSARDLSLSVDGDFALFINGDGSEVSNVVAIMNTAIDVRLRNVNILSGEAASQSPFRASGGSVVV